MKGGRDLWTRTPVDLPQGSPWTSAGLSRTPAHFRCTRALLSLLISAASAASSFHRVKLRLSASRDSFDPDKRRNPAPSEPPELSEPPEPRRFRTQLLTMLLRSRPAVRSLSARPGNSPLTSTQTEVINSRSRSGSDSLLGDSRPGVLCAYRFRRTSPTVNSDLPLG